MIGRSLSPSVAPMAALSSWMLIRVIASSSGKGGIWRQFQYDNRPVRGLSTWILDADPRSFEEGHVDSWSKRSSVSTKYPPMRPLLLYHGPASGSNLGLTWYAGVPRTVEFDPVGAHQGHPNHPIWRQGCFLVSASQYRGPPG